MSKGEDKKSYDAWEALAVGALMVCLSSLMALVIAMVSIAVKDHLIDPPEERFQRICTEHSLDSESYNNCMIELYVAEEQSGDL